MAMPVIQGKHSKKNHALFNESNMNNNIVTMQNICASKMMVSLKSVNLKSIYIYIYFNV